MYELKKGEIINNFSFFMQTHHRTFHISHQPKKRQNKKWQQINYFGHWTSWPSTPKKNCYKNDNLYNRFVQRNVQRLSRARKKIEIILQIENKNWHWTHKVCHPIFICLFHLFEFLSEKYYSEMSQPLSEWSNTYFT